MNKPVYVFSGFIDSGKTSAIKETLCDPRFNEGESSLIIVLEKGDVEYDDQFLRATNSKVVFLDSVNDLTHSKQRELDKQYRPDRVFIELNGMEDDNILYNTGFISKWELAQSLTTICARSFYLYITNLKQFVYNHVIHADVCIINRFVNPDKRYLRNNLKGMNRRLELVFEDEDGNVTSGIDETMFDVSKELKISDVDYGLWYMETIDHPSKFEGATVEITAKKLSDIAEYKNALIMGRNAMVCCANDIQPVGIICSQIDKSKIRDDTFYRLKGKISVLKDEEGYKNCVLFVDECEEANAPSNEMVYFN